MKRSDGDVVTLGDAFRAIAGFPVDAEAAAKLVALADRALPDGRGQRGELTRGQLNALGLSDTRVGELGWRE